MVCAECMKMCCLGGKNSVVKGLNSRTQSGAALYVAISYVVTCCTADRKTMVLSHESKLSPLR